MSVTAIKVDERVKNVHFTEDTLSVDLMDGRTITVPLVWYPRLVKKATGGALKFLSPLQATGHYGIFPTDRTTALQFGRPKGRGIQPSRD